MLESTMCRAVMRLSFALLALGCSSSRPIVATTSTADRPVLSAADPSASAPAPSVVVERPATADDLRILERADEILTDATKWDRADDRVCNDTDTTWSLFCAVKQASEEVLGMYRHEDKMGQAATREVRRVIEELNPGRTFKHRLMDYNNLPSTTFEDMKKVLHLARQRVAAQLGTAAR